MSAPPFEDAKRVNDQRVLAAERHGSGTVDGWPMHGVFEFTGACNLHCFMCGYEMLRDDLRAAGRPRFTMPLETFRMVAERAFPHMRTINPTLSGEPFVLPYFEEFIDTVARFGCKLEMFTNGMLLCGDRMEHMMPHLQRLTVSFDGASKATFEHVRTGGDFDTVMTNVRAFARARRHLGLRHDIKFCFNVVLMRENVHELPRIMEIAAANDVDFVSACYVIITSERIRASSPMHCPEVTNRALDEARAIAASHGIEIEFPEPLPPDAAARLAAAAAESTSDGPPPDAHQESTAEQTPTAQAPEQLAAAPSAPAAGSPVPTVASAAQTPEPKECGAAASHEPSETTLPMAQPADYGGKYYCDMPWRRVFVGLNGEVFPCCAPDRPILGNAFEQEFEDIWNGPEYQRLRVGLYTGELTDYCRKCPYLQKAGALPYEID